MNFKYFAMIIFFVGIVFWFFLWRILVGYDETRNNRLLHLPLWGCALVLLINIVLAFIAEIPKYGVEIGIYGFVESNAKTIAAFTLGIAVFVVLTFDEKTVRLLDQEKSREFLLLIFSSFIFSIMGVLPLYWVPQVFGWLTMLRHLKTVPYTYSLFLLATAMLIYLNEILGVRSKNNKIDDGNKE